MAAIAVATMAGRGGVEDDYRGRGDRDDGSATVAVEASAADSGLAHDSSSLGCVAASYPQLPAEPQSQEFTSVPTWSNDPAGSHRTYRESLELMGSPPASDFSSSCA